MWRDCVMSTPTFRAKQLSKAHILLQFTWVALTIDIQTTLARNIYKLTIRVPVHTAELGTPAMSRFLRVLATCRNNSTAKRYSWIRMKLLYAPGSSWWGGYRYVNFRLSNCLGPSAATRDTELTVIETKSRNIYHQGR